VSVGSRAFDVVYRAEYAGLKRLAFLLTHSDAEAEDVVQDVFIRCRSRLDSLDDPGSFLRRSVINACRSLYRRDRRRGAATLSDDDLAVLPVELVELRDALCRLRPRQRLAIVLRYYLDLPFEDVASAIGCRPATARSLVHRALDELREVLG
jgi:RNA polymerase sigma factor (sigma-70 family)